MNASAVPDTPVPFHPASSPDFIPRDPLRAMQSARLRQVVARMFEHVAVFRQRMNKSGLTPADIHGIDDLAKLPFTTKDDLAEAYPLGMLAIPRQQVARMNSLGGAAASRPVLSAHSRADLLVWTELLVRALASCGIHPGDVLLNACRETLLSDRLGLNNGAEALGATLVPIAGASIDRQASVIKDVGVSAICATPSHFLYLAERAEKLGVDLRELPLRSAALVAEFWSDALRQRIEASAGIKAYAIYGLAEILGPGIGAECFHQSGLHIFEDHFYPEIIDPATGTPLPDGQEGELVLTTLSREAMPACRFRTGEITAIRPEPCQCGRTLRQIERIGRHRDEACVLRGVDVFPSQIEAALAAMEHPVPQYQIVLSHEKGLDSVEVRIEVTPEIFSDQVSAMETVRSRLASAIEQTLGVRVPVRLVEPNTLRPSRAQANRILDKRGNG